MRVNNHRIFVKYRLYCLLPLFIFHHPDFEVNSSLIPRRPLGERKLPDPQLLLVGIRVNNLVIFMNKARPFIN